LKQEIDKRAYVIYGSIDEEIKILEEK